MENAKKYLLNESKRNGLHLHSFYTLSFLPAIYFIAFSFA